MLLSNYMDGKKSAETFLENGVYGCNFYKKEKQIEALGKIGFFLEPKHK